MSRPAYGTAPIKCSRRACKWRGYETGLVPVPHKTISGVTSQVCPTCGCDSYYTMTDREMKAAGLTTKEAK